MDVVDIWSEAIASIIERRKAEEAQTTLFGGRGSKVVSEGPGFWASSTWMARRAWMDDYKVRALCPNLQFVTRTARNDKGGAKNIVYDPPEECWFPSHKFPTFNGQKTVIGDDGTTWILGSRGNGHDVLRAEIIADDRLWPEEKTEVLTWLRESRVLRVETDAAGEEKAVADMICIVDSHYCQRISDGLPVTEAQILAAGLPERGGKPSIQPPQLQAAMPTLVGFWSEHAASEGPDSWPASTEVSRLGVGLVLIPCLDEPSIFVLRGVYEDYEVAKAAMESFGEPNLETWLATWKASHTAFMKAETRAFGSQLDKDGA